MHTNNILLSQYQKHQTSSVNPLFQRNKLIGSNALLTPQKITSLTREARETEQMQRYRKTNEKSQLSDSDLLLKKIIQPIKIKKISNIDVQDEYDKRGTTWESEREKLLEGRTNEPYKHIIKDFDFKKKIKDEKDLIVHKVSKKDKEGVAEEMKVEKNTREKLDSENKVIYSASKATEHKKKFIYQHRYKYRIKHETPTHVELKEDKVEYYKNEQENIEKGKKTKDALMNFILDYDDIENISGEGTKTKDKLKNELNTMDSKDDDIATRDKQIDTEVKRVDKELELELEKEEKDRKEKKKVKESTKLIEENSVTIKPTTTTTKTKIKIDDDIYSIEPKKDSPVKRPPIRVPFRTKYVHR